MWTHLLLCAALAQDAAPPTVPPSPCAERIETARAHLDAGRAADGLAELDRALAEHPGDAGVRAFLAERRDTRGLGVALDLGETPDEDHARRALEAAAAKADDFPPAARELALLELREWSYVELGPEATGAACDEWLVHASDARRRFAAEWLRQEYRPARSTDLLARTLLDRDEGVRVAAATALGSSGEVALIAPVARALGHEHPLVREHAALALGHMGLPAAVPALASALLAPPSGGWSPPASYVFIGRQSAYVQDFDVEVATGAAIADPVINVLTEGAVLEAKLLHVEPQKLRTILRASLVRLTGSDPGVSTAAQAQWWEANRERYEALLPEAPPAGTE